jgi:hypothetical protein
VRTKEPSDVCNIEQPRCIRPARCISRPLHRVRYLDSVIDSTQCPHRLTVCAARVQLYKSVSQSIREYDAVRCDLPRRRHGFAKLQPPHYLQLSDHTRRTAFATTRITLEHSPESISCAAHSQASDGRACISQQHDPETVIFQAASGRVTASGSRSLPTSDSVNTECVDAACEGTLHVSVHQCSTWRCSTAEPRPTRRRVRRSRECGLQYRSWLGRRSSAYRGMEGSMNRKISLGCNGAAAHSTAHLERGAT